MDEMGHVSYHRAFRTRPVPRLDTNPFKCGWADEEDYHLICYICWLCKNPELLVKFTADFDQCVGNMAGSQIFKTKDAPQYIPGTIGCAICLGTEFVLICSWRGYYMWQNKRRDLAAAESGISKEEQERLGREMGEQNITDLENPYFRYTM